MSLKWFRRNSDDAHESNEVPTVEVHEFAFGEYAECVAGIVQNMFEQGPIADAFDQLPHTAMRDADFWPKVYCYVLAVTRWVLVSIHPDDPTTYSSIGRRATEVFFDHATLPSAPAGIKQAMLAEMEVNIGHYYNPLHSDMPNWQAPRLLAESLGLTGDILEWAALPASFVPTVATLKDYFGQLKLRESKG